MPSPRPSTRRSSRRICRSTTIRASPRSWWYAMTKAVAAILARAGSTDTAKMVEAAEGAGVDTPFGPIAFRAADHQSTMGAYVGRIALENGKGAMVDWRYADGADYLPSPGRGSGVAFIRHVAFRVMLPIH